MKTVYMCEKCKKTHDTRDDASICESSHEEAKSITYSYNYGGRFPNMIHCKFNGYVTTYYASHRLESDQE